MKPSQFGEMEKQWRKQQKNQLVCLSYTCWEMSMFTYLCGRNPPLSECKLLEQHSQETHTEIRVTVTQVTHTQRKEIDGNLPCICTILFFSVETIMFG